MMSCGSINGHGSILTPEDSSHGPPLTPNWPRIFVIFLRDAQKTVLGLFFLPLLFPFIAINVVTFFYGDQSQSFDVQVNTDTWSPLRRSCLYLLAVNPRDL